MNLRRPESLESRLLLTAAVTSLNAVETPLRIGEPIELRAVLNNSDAETVRFYLDDGNGRLDPNADTLVGVDRANNGWNTTVPTSGTYRIMPIGDSITASEPPFDSYRRPLQQLLDQSNYDFDFVGTANGPNSDFDSDYEGRFGWRADEVLAQLPNWLDQNTPDIVLLHLGTNDLFANQSIDSTLNELEQIIDQFRERNPRVVVLTSLLIPTNFPSNASIDAFNQQLPARVAQWDSTDSPVLLVDNNTPIDPVDHLYDGVHPNAAGEQIMAETWFDAITEARPLANPNGAFGTGSHTFFAVAEDANGNLGSSRSTNVTLVEVDESSGAAIAGVNSGEELWVARSNGLTLDTSFEGQFPGGSYLNFGHGDVNGDGRDDIVGHRTDGDLVVALATSSGGFTFSVWGGLNSNVTWTEFYVADFTGDGRADVAARSGSSGSWHVASSNGSSFSDSVWSKYPTSIDWTFLLGDFNGDGRHDITGRASSNGSWWTAVSNGSGFSNQQWATWTTSVSWEDFVVGDFNGDGSDDIAGRAMNRSWFVGRSTSSSFNTSFATSWTTTVTWNDVRVGDFNGDGLDDIAGRANGQWWIAMSNEDSQLMTNRFWGFWTTSTTWSDVRVIDINGDGKDDLLGRAGNGEWWTFVAAREDRFVGVRAARWAALSVWQSLQIVDLG